MIKFKLNNVFAPLVNIFLLPRLECWFQVLHQVLFFTVVIGVTQCAKGRLNGRIFSKVPLKHPQSSSQAPQISFASSKRDSKARSLKPFKSSELKKISKLLKRPEIRTTDNNLTYDTITKIVSQFLRLLRVHLVKYPWTVVDPRTTTVMINSTTLQRTYMPV